MTDILIISKPDDIHARAVRRGLQALGADPYLWFCEHFPASQGQSLTLDDDGSPILAIAEEDGGHRLESAALRSVWMRRGRIPASPESVHADDRAFADRELSYYQRGLWAALAPDAFWVNPYYCGRRADSKILQLGVAKRSGLAVPETIISNIPDRIRKFLDSHSAAGVIYKPFAVTDWREEDGRILGTMTTVITEYTLPDDDMLAATPNIFQRRIPKAYEVRLTMMGGHAVAIKIDSQAHPDGQVDWRNIFATEFLLEVIDLPEQVMQSCRRLMSTLGLVFGCIDLIVTPDNEVVFLEVNEMGQWLWIEANLPETLLLDAFCRFLMSGSRDYRYEKPGKPLEFHDFIEGKSLVADV